MFARRQRDQFDAICVGINTVLKDNPKLDGYRKSKRLKRIVLDSYLRIPNKAKLFTGIKASDCIIATTRKSSKKNVEVASEGHERFR